MARAERRRIVAETRKLGIDLKIDPEFKPQPDTDPREMVQILPLRQFSKQDLEIIPQLVAPLAERFAKEVGNEFGLTYTPRTLQDTVLESAVETPELIENVG